MPEKLRSILIIGLGYVAAVAAAATVSASILARAEPDYGFLLPLTFAASMIASAGLPGFLATIILAHKHRWTGWLPFTVAGGLNAILAWFAMSQIGMGFADAPLLEASIRGGVAGGVVYWWTVYSRAFKRTEA